MLFLYIYVILYAFQTSQSYDLEIEAVFRMKPEFVEQMRRNMKRHDVLRPEALGFQFPGLQLDPLNKFMKSLIISRKLGQDERTVIADYIDHLVQKGLEKLETISEVLNETLKLENDITPTLNSVVSDYILKLQNYFSYVVKQHADNRLDREFLIIDLLETSNEILLGAEIKMLTAVTANYESALEKRHIIELKDMIKKKNMEDKIKEMKYLCAKLDICRPFPGFTDYFSDLLDVVFGLKDDKLHDLLAILKTLLKRKTDLLDSILGEKLTTYIGSKLKSLTIANGDLTNIRELIVLLRSVITQRHKQIHSPDKEVVIKTKAIRILLDIIDKTFTFDSDDLLTIKADSVMKSVIHWAASNRTDIEPTLKSCINFVLGKFKYHWNANTREEVKTLIEIIWKGKSQNKYLSEYLFQKGSDFINEDKLSVALKGMKMRL